MQLTLMVSKMNKIKRKSMRLKTYGKHSFLLKASGVILMLAALPLVVGGAYLAWLGGSWYYLLCGSLLSVTAVKIFQGRAISLVLFAVATGATVLWSLWEVGPNFWPLVPRLAPFFVMTIVICLLVPRFEEKWRGKAYLIAGLTAVSALIFIGIAFYPRGSVTSASYNARDYDSSSSSTNWQYYGRDASGTRFAPLEEITPDNVENLEVAWSYRTGDSGVVGSEYQVTPIQIDNSLYICTPLNRVISINADTGEEQWSFDPQVNNNGIWNRCRGVGYFMSDVLSDGDPCFERIVVSTLDGRLIQVDARTGALCEAFGDSGTVDLTLKMGDIPPTFYQPTSMPTVIGGLIVLGGWVFDNIGVDMPSGVVRAFDAENGSLVWAWDVGRPEGQNPVGEEVYTRSTPNMWSTPSVDLELGLIYLPTGNQTPDYWGADRMAESERVSSSVVALDLATGEERWVFQTVHHDIWDLDVASQPALYDMEGNDGVIIPVLVQATKRGQIFVLDRRTGEPVFPVEELPVPLAHQSPDWVSPTQPYSTGFAAIGADKLTEARMWGLTFYDQMLCRIMFKGMRYEGDFTAPSVVPTLFFPGNFGGMNWGSVSIDEGNGMLIVNDIRLPQGLRLVDQDNVEQGNSGAHGTGMQSQAGAPYAAEGLDVNSVLGLPCIAPPWGTLSGIDMRSGQLKWQQPAGTVKDVRFAGFKVGLGLPLGLPTLGGPMTTGSGLVFYSGTQDYYLRALSSSTGNELWKGRLPVGSQATPMSYISPETGRQYVVVVAGGARESLDKGDYVIAYSLPE